jgi:hypothetical protein
MNGEKREREEDREDKGRGKEEMQTERGREGRRLDNYFKEKGERKEKIEITEA